ncbi:MAG: hypothetical protein EOO55_03285 [Hymenobacter sp.]|nr:MAG: hypothetical protein EOO55_03285 [Hymenobacter sp.]
MKQIFHSTLGILLLSSLTGIAQVQKTQTYITFPTCTEGYNTVDYRNKQSCSPSVEKRNDTETIGNTSFTFSNYRSTIAGSGLTAAGRADDVFQYTDAYSSQILGSALVWRQNSTDTEIASEQGAVILSSPYKAQVTITFNREVKNLRLTIQDIDKALLNSNQGSDFTDEVDFYPTDAAGNPVPLSGDGHSAGSTVLVGFGRPVNGEYGWYGNIGSSTTGASTNSPSTATCAYSIETRDGATQAVLRGVGLNGKSASGPSREGNATIVFAKPVKKLVLTYRNLYTRTSSALRLQTIAIEKIGWCRETNPLPVTLTTFDAKAAGANANLTWATASEANNDYFGVERSFDGVSFTAIGKVAGHGTTATFSNYAYTDAGVAAKASGTVYYRLRQVDLDGTSTYSPVRTVAFEMGAASLKLYPNPATPGDDKLTLDLLTLPQGDYQANLVNVLGSTVATYTVHGGEAQPVALPAALAAGTYIMVVQGQGLHLTQRLAQQ